MFLKIGLICFCEKYKSLFSIDFGVQYHSDMLLSALWDRRRDGGPPSHVRGWCSRWEWSWSCPEDPLQSPQWCKPSVPCEQAETSLPSEELCLFWSRDVWKSDSCPEWLPEIWCLQLKHDYWGTQIKKLYKIKYKVVIKLKVAYKNIIEKLVKKTKKKTYSGSCRRVS